MVSHLGTGEFGTVSKGQWTSEGRVMEVAVKTLTDSANTVKFLQEAAIMAQFRHPNVTALRGVVSQGTPVCLLYSNFDFWTLPLVIENDGIGTHAQRGLASLSQCPQLRVGYIDFNSVSHLSFPHFFFLTKTEQMDLQSCF